MAILGGWAFLMSEVPMYISRGFTRATQPASVSPPRCHGGLLWVSRGVLGGGAFYYGRGTPVAIRLPNKSQLCRQAAVYVVGDPQEEMPHVGNTPCNVKVVIWAVRAHTKAKL